MPIAAACQPASTDLTDERIAEIAAQVNAVHNANLNAWREADVNRGMSFCLNSPDFTIAVSGQFIHGYPTLYDGARSWLSKVESETTTITDSQTTVLASNVVCALEQYLASKTYADGLTGPELTVARTHIYVREDGEWKAHSALQSSPPQQGNNGNALPQQFLQPV